jgi:hypothetical protein
MPSHPCCTPISQRLGFKTTSLIGPSIKLAIIHITATMSSLRLGKLNGSDWADHELT